MNKTPKREKKDVSGPMGDYSPQAVATSRFVSGVGTEGGRRLNVHPQHVAHDARHFGAARGVLREHHVLVVPIVPCRPPRPLFFTFGCCDPTPNPVFKDPSVSYPMLSSNAPTVVHVYHGEGPSSQMPKAWTLELVVVTSRRARLCAFTRPLFRCTFRGTTAQKRRCRSR